VGEVVEEQGDGSVGGVHARWPLNDSHPVDVCSLCEVAPCEQQDCQVRGGQDQRDDVTSYVMA
jgi:hypothetical protein